MVRNGYAKEAFFIKTGIYHTPCINIAHMGEVLLAGDVRFFLVRYRFPVPTVGRD